ncbi:MAG: PHP domain-containing protein [Acidobacteriota bacterium]
MKLKNTLKIVLLFLLLIFLLNYKKFFFTPYKSDVNSSELEGVIHVHSILSDGKSDVKQISEEAKKAGLDFLILTDHGHPNFKSLKQEGIHNSISVISGSEISVHEGHLLGIGFEEPTYKFSPVGKEAMEDVREGGGISIIAHPNSKKVPWNGNFDGNFNGIEIINIDSQMRGHNLVSLVTLPFIYPINPLYAFLRIIKNPVEEIKKWDSLNKKGEVWGFYALDAHGKLSITESFSLPFPSYSSLFRIIKLHIPVEKDFPINFREKRALILNSLKNGKFYSSIDGASSSRGFRFYGKKGNKFLSAGEIEEKESDLFVEASFNFPFEIHLIKNGETIKKSKEKILKYRVKENGFYRAEVHLINNPVLREDVPWILSNPIYMRSKKTDEINGQKNELLKEKFLTDFKNEKYFVEEKDQKSWVHTEISEDGNKNYLLMKFKLGIPEKKNENLWCALTRREYMNFNEYKGLSFNIKSDKKLRVWFQVRDIFQNEERWWARSVKIKENWEEKIIYFKDLYNIKGKKDYPINLKYITGIFFVFDRGSTIEGTDGKIYLSKLCLIY